jgi:hypothetical protein
MKLKVSFYDPVSGFVYFIATLSREQEVQESCPEGAEVFDEHVDHKTQYLPGGVPTERPTVPIMQNPYPAGQLPVGTEISIVDDLGAVMTLHDPGELIEFSDAGIYQVSVMPPFPYIPVSGEVVVT